MLTTTTTTTNPLNTRNLLSLQHQPSPCLDPDASTTTSIVLLPKVPVTEDSNFDLVTLSLVLFLLAVSVVSIILVLHLRVKSRSARRLHRFTFHSSARILFACLISLWALNELLRLPITRIRAIITSFPALSKAQQIQLCTIHFVLSLGVLEPAFLVSLLFLVNISIKHDDGGGSGSKRNIIWSMIGCILTVSLPICATLYLALYQLPARVSIPTVFVRTAVVFADHKGREVVLCASPLAGAVVFGAFGVMYSLVLLFSCWRVISLAINKWLRSRINTLAMVVLICLGVQVVLSSLSVFWDPERVEYYVLVLVVFASLVLCAVVGEGILVLIPVGDALSIGVGRGGGGREDDDNDVATVTMDNTGGV